jgi:hypothetical protein
MTPPFGSPRAPSDPHGDMRAAFLASLEFGVNPLVGRDTPEPIETERDRT